MYTTSGEDLLGQYAGETKVVVEEKVAAAQGAVLYIAQAAAMSRGMYGTEAIGKLVSMLYNTQSHVILSGERDEMEELLRHHPGLRGHFNETVHFKEWSVAKCVRLVMERLAKNGLMRYEWQGKFLWRRQRKRRFHVPVSQSVVQLFCRRLRQHESHFFSLVLLLRTSNSI